MKKIVVSSLVSLFVLSCSIPVTNNLTNNPSSSLIGRMPHRDFRWSQYASAGYSSLVLDTSSPSPQTPLLGGAGVGSLHPSLIKDNFSDLEKEYKSFSTKALSDAYVKRMFNKYLTTSPNPTQVIRQLEFARYLKSKSDTSYFDSLRTIIANENSLYTKITDFTEVSQKMTTESGTFGDFVRSISPLPGTPVSTTASAITSSSFTANWNSVANATGYKLYIDGTPVTLGLVTAYNKTGLTDGTTHTYYVKAINAAGESPVSNTITVNLPLASPVATSATNIAQTSFTANWTPFANATGYKFYLDGNTTPITLGLVSSYNVIGLTKGTYHYYRVKAILNTGDSPVSNLISLYTSFDEFKVNTYSTGSKNYSSVAMSDDGRFVISWTGQGRDGDATNELNVYAQKYNADGSLNGSEFRVNTWTTGSQFYTSVAIADDGRFVISWQSYGQDGDTGSISNIYAQKYNADGSLNGSEFRVNSYTTESQTNTSVAMADDGRFVISWYGTGQGDSLGIFAQKYNADGTLNGSEFKVNTYTAGNQFNPSIAMADDGRFIISWQGSGTGDIGGGIFAQKYNADGSLNDSEFRVNTYTANTQYYPSTAMANDGRFIISWDGQGQGDADGGIFVQKYNADGTPNGTEFKANTYTVNTQDKPSVGIGNDGRFVVSWQSQAQDGDNAYNIYAQKYNADGSLNGSVFRVNSWTTNTQQNPSIAMPDDGRFVISWDGSGSGENGAIYAKRYDSNGNAL